MNGLETAQTNRFPTVFYIEVAAMVLEPQNSIKGATEKHPPLLL